MFVHNIYKIENARVKTKTSIDKMIINSFEWLRQKCSDCICGRLYHLILNLNFKIMMSVERNRQRGQEGVINDLHNFK